MAGTVAKQRDPAGGFGRCVMTLYHKWPVMRDPPPGYYEEAGAAMETARKVCEIAGGFSDREIAKVQCEAMITAMVKYGLLFEGPPYDPPKVQIIEGVEYVARRASRSGATS